MNIHDFATHLHALNPFSAEKARQKQARSQLDLAARFTDKGIFEYADNGFILRTLNRETRMPWAEVQSIIAYQSNNYRIDIIWLCVVCEDAEHTFHINEETDGWYIFLAKIAEQFPMIPENWQRNFNAAAPSILYLKDKLIRAHVLDNLSVNQGF